MVIWLLRRARLLGAAVFLVAVLGVLTPIPVDRPVPGMATDCGTAVSALLPVRWPPPDGELGMIVAANSPAGRLALGCVDARWTRWVWFGLTVLAGASLLTVGAQRELGFPTVGPAATGATW